MLEKSALCPYLAPKPSRGLTAFLLGVHGLSFLAAWLNPLDIRIRLLVSLGVLTSLWLSLRRSRTGPEIRGIRLKPDGSWSLHTKDGAEIEAHLMRSSLANPWFVLLHFLAEEDSANAEGRAPSNATFRPGSVKKSGFASRLHPPRYSVLICRDSLDLDAFRRLRVALRVSAMHDSKPGSFS